MTMTKGTIADVLHDDFLAGPPAVHTSPPPSRCRRVGRVSGVRCGGKMYDSSTQLTTERTCLRCGWIWYAQ